MIKIDDCLNAALEERSIFHSEADFQHHLAWHIHNKDENLKVRLEYPFSRTGDKTREYCDIVLLHESEKIGIELKYQTKKHEEILNGEKFSLKDQGAPDFGRYDFCKDISRLEKWCREGKMRMGYAIFLTNDKEYWDKPKAGNPKKTADHEFRIHEGRTISGDLNWKGAGEGTTQGRDQLKLVGEYVVHWTDVPQSPEYKVPESKSSQSPKAESESNFKYAIIDVTGTR